MPVLLCYAVYKRGVRCSHGLFDTARQARGRDTLYVLCYT